MRFNSRLGLSFQHSTSHSFINRLIIHLFVFVFTIIPSGKTYFGKVFHLKKISGFNFSFVAKTDNITVKFDFSCPFEEINTWSLSLLSTVWFTTISKRTGNLPAFLKLLGEISVDSDTANSEYFDFFVVAIRKWLADTHPPSNHKSTSYSFRTSEVLSKNLPIQNLWPTESPLFWSSLSSFLCFGFACQLSNF